MIKQYGEPDDYCTRASNEAQLALAHAKYDYSEPNDVRDVMDKKLQAYGWCFGERGQTNSQMKWRRCNANSCLTMKLPLSLPIRRIAVTSQGEAIAATLPLGLLAVEPNVNDMRGPG